MALPQHVRFWKNFGFRELKNNYSNVVINEENIQKIRKQLASILMENAVRFEANVPVRVKKITYNKKISELSENKYPEIILNEKETIIVDFLFPDPIEIFWSTHPIRAIIVADELDLNVMAKRRALELKGIPTFIALKQDVGFWEKWFFRVNFNPRSL